MIMFSVLDRTYSHRGFTDLGYSTSLTISKPIFGRFHILADKFSGTMSSGDEEITPRGFRGRLSSSMLVLIIAAMCFPVLKGHLDTLAQFWGCRIV